MPLDDLVDQIRALNFDLARFSSAEQEATIEAAATEIERLRAREAEVAATIGRLAAERDASAHNEREVRKHLACRIEAADRAYAEIEELRAEVVRLRADRDTLVQFIDSAVKAACGTAEGNHGDPTA